MKYLLLTIMYVTMMYGGRFEQTLAKTAENMGGDTLTTEWIGELVFVKDRNHRDQLSWQLKTTDTVIFGLRSDGVLVWKKRREK